VLCFSDSDSGRGSFCGKGGSEGGGKLTFGGGGGCDG
jgi:hypothetical protein